jgi:hypothetical protein
MNYAATARKKVYLYRINHASIGSQNFTGYSKSRVHVTVKFSDFIVQCTEHSK